MQKIQDLELFAQVIAKTADVICSRYCLSECSKLRAARAARLFLLIRPIIVLAAMFVAVAVSDANTLRKTLKITVSVMSTTMFTGTRSIPRQNLHLVFLKIRAACLSVVYNNTIIVRFLSKRRPVVRL